MLAENVDQERQPCGRATGVQRPSGLNPKLHQPRAAAVQCPPTGRRERKGLARRPRELVVDRRQELLGPQCRRWRQLAIVEIALGQFVAGGAGNQGHRHALQLRIRQRPHPRMETRAAEEEQIVAEDRGKVVAHGLPPRHFPQVRVIVEILPTALYRPAIEISVLCRIQTRGTKGLGQLLAWQTGPWPVGRQHLGGRWRRRRHDGQIALDQKLRSIEGDFLPAPRGSDPVGRRRLLRPAVDQQVPMGYEHEHH